MSGNSVGSGSPTGEVAPPANGTVQRAREPRRPIGDVAQWYIVTRHQLSHYLRSYRFLGLLLFVLLVSLLALAFQVSAGVAATRVAQLGSSSEYISNFLAYAGLWIVLSAAFFGGDALSVDFSTGAGYYMLVLPIRRPTLLAGRYAAATAVTVSVVLLYYAVGLLGGAYFFGPSAIAWTLVAISLGIAVLFTLAALAVAFTISAFFRSPAAGVLVTILTLYVGFTTLQGVVEFAGFEPWFSLSYAGGVLPESLDTDFVHFQAIPLGSDQYTTLWNATILEGVEIMLAYLAVFLGLSVALYQRKESTG